jgi:vacuolar-type H+-ATPase subunit I/STV1
VRAAHVLIEKIAASSGVPSAGRRHEIVRELRAHVDDFAASARREGHDEDEIQRMVVASFGDPRRFAANYAWVYRRERTAVRLAVFSLGTAAIAAAISAVIFTMQAGAAIGFGVPPWNALAARHTAIEAVDILVTVAAYVGLLSLESLFERRRFQKAIAVLSSAVLFSSCVFASAGVRAGFLIFGCVNAVFLRSLQKSLVSGKSRLAVALAYFGLLGGFFFAVRPQPSGSLTPTLVSWLIAGMGYHLMTLLAVRVDRELSGRLPHR